MNNIQSTKFNAVFTAYVTTVNNLYIHANISNLVAYYITGNDLHLLDAMWSCIQQPDIINLKPFTMNNHQNHHLQPTCICCFHLQHLSQESIQFYNSLSIALFRFWGSHLRSLKFLCCFLISHCNWCQFLTNTVMYLKILCNTSVQTHCFTFAQFRFFILWRYTFLLASSRHSTIKCTVLWWIHQQKL